MLEGHPIRRAPDWLKDNNYPLHGRWPPMPSSWACFKSIFCIYTETGNIWTLLLGFVLFLFLGILTTLRPNMYFMAPPSGEGGVWDVPPGSGALPQLLLALPHCLLSFRESLPDFLQVSHRDGGGGTTCCPHASDPGAGGSWQLQGLLKIP